MRLIVTATIIICWAVSTVAEAATKTVTFDFAQLGLSSRSTYTALDTTGTESVLVRSVLDFGGGGYNPFVGGDVTFRRGGLGVDNSGVFVFNVDNNPVHIDGRGLNDGLLFSFDAPVSVLSASFGAVDANDEFNLYADFSGDGRGLVRRASNRDIPSSTTAFFNNLTNVEEVAIAAFDNNDNFLVRALTVEFPVSTVPIPASGLLFLSAIAGGALLRRRRAASLG